MTDDYGIIGINTLTIDDIKKQVIKCAEDSNTIINKIDLIIENSKSYFKCPAGDKFREKYEVISREKQRINENILSYNTDLSNASETFKNEFDKIEDVFTGMRN
jgi:flagellar capping protein FliD